jgi:hypothetical protein
LKQNGSFQSFFLSQLNLCFAPAMNAKFRFGLVFLSLFVGVASASAADSVRVKSSGRFLRVVVIDATKPDASRVSVHETFASSLAASMQRQGVPFGVKLSEDTDAAKVAADLTAGAYDAALVFENIVPAALSTPNFVASRGISQVGVPVRIFHLVVRNNDAGLVAMLNTAFSDTVKAPHFQEALSRSTAIRVVASNNR